MAIAQVGHIELARVPALMSEWARAETHFHTALEIARGGDQTREALAMAGLADVYRHTHRLDGATASARSAVAIIETINPPTPVDEAVSRAVLGLVCLDAGNRREAMTQLSSARRLYEQVGAKGRACDAVVTALARLDKPTASGRSIPRK